MIAFVKMDRWVTTTLFKIMFQIKGVDNFQTIPTRKKNMGIWILIKDHQVLIKTVKRPIAAFHKEYNERLWRGYVGNFDQ